MKQARSIADRISSLMNADVVEKAGKYKVKKSRTLDINMDGMVFPCLLEMDIYFEGLAEDGTAFNKAEILLLPKECKTFLIALIQYGIPLPPVYRQWQSGQSEYRGFVLGSHRAAGTFCRTLVRGVPSN